MKDKEGERNPDVEGQRWTQHFECTRIKKNVATGGVMIMGDSEPQSLWVLGRVTQMIPDANEGGKKFPDAEGQRLGWAEHFEELLSRPAPLNPADIQPAEGDLPIPVMCLPRRRSTRQLNH